MPSGRQGHGRPHDQAGDLAYPGPGNEGRKNNIQGREKAGVGDSGGPDARLLQPGGNKECNPAQHRNRPQPLVPALRCLPSFEPGQWGESQCCDRAAGGYEGQGADVVHGRFLE